METYVIFGVDYCIEYDEGGVAGLCQALVSGRALEGEVLVIDESYEVRDVLNLSYIWGHFRIITKSEYKELIPRRDEIMYRVINKISMDLNQGKIGKVYNLIDDLCQENLTRLSFYLVDNKGLDLKL